MFRRFEKWDLIRYPAICFWVAWSILMPEDGLFSSFAFVIAVIAIIVSFLLKTFENAKLSELSEEHERRRDEWLETTRNDSLGNFHATFIDKEKQLREFAKMIKPFLSRLPSWSGFVESIDKMTVSKDYGTLCDLAEWIYYAEHGKISRRNVSPDGKTICPYYDSISPKMREEFFVAIDEELRKFGVRSEPVVRIDGQRFLLKDYLMSNGYGSTKNDDSFGWIANCPSATIPSFLLRGIK